MKKIAPKDIDKNVIKLIGQDWMLVTAGDQEKFNMMTASWGSMGYLWNKPVVMVFVRPQRYTFEFTEKKDEFTLSFFDEKYRHALNVCGSVSGRDVNKVQESARTVLQGFIVCDRRQIPDHLRGTGAASDRFLPVFCSKCRHCDGRCG